MKIIRKKFFFPILIFLLAALFWGNTSIEREEFTFSSPALPENFDGFRIVQLSDLHGREFGEDNAQLLAAVENSAPDLIALTGDFVDSASNPEDLREFLRALTALAPTYYVTGNHEWGSHQAKACVDVFSDCGVVCLENEYVPITRDEDTVFLAGIHDPNGYADQKTPQALAGELYAAEDDPFWLLLAHRNNLFSGTYCRLGADLTLSGHGHGGIWRLPFTDGLFSTNLTLFPSFTDGFYRCTDGDCEGSYVFVSRGLGNSPHYVPRIFNRPQLAVITLEKAR
ncbi:MAG: metallophosphoesterase [Oscillospiraceae bacterium]|nr:metallophosphoesterase [Oscillospiraceae bacterium]